MKVSSAPDPGLLFSHHGTVASALGVLLKLVVDHRVSTIFCLMRVLSNSVPDMLKGSTSLVHTVWSKDGCYLALLPPILPIFANVKEKVETHHMSSDCGKNISS